MAQRWVRYLPALTVFRSSAIYLSTGRARTVSKSSPPPAELLRRVIPSGCKTIRPKRLYWGETHIHTGYAEGQGSVDGLYQYAPR